MNKNITITVSVSTNPDTAHLGRYFVDVRDTTHNPDPVQARQMTTRVLGHDKAVEFIGDVTREARKHNVRVTVKDRTEELKL